MNKPDLDYVVLDECLRGLAHLVIDVKRLRHEPKFRERRGGYCQLTVSTLDAEEPSASKLVAVKKLFLGSRSYVPRRLAFRLARELKIWANLQHPHVLPLLGFYLDDGGDAAILISEYMIHGDLTDYMAAAERGAEERLYLVRDITEGLEYLHTRDPPIRHGDLKPGNVLVNHNRRALLADFGLSNALDVGPTGFTTGNDERCTVRYSSPEILNDGKSARSLANDMWSWACLVSEVLTDEMPYSTVHSELQVLRALMQEKVPYHAISSSKVEQSELREALEQCWKVQKHLRPDARTCLDIVTRALLPGLRNAAAGQGWPRNITYQMAQQLDREGLQVIANAGAAAAAAQHQPPQQQQAPAPPHAPSTQPTQPTQPSPRANQHNQPDQHVQRQIQFDEFFTSAFNGWLRQRQLTLDPPLLDGQQVELHKLFLMVGALGGGRAVSDRNLWQVVGARIGFPDLNGPLPYSKPEVADQLAGIYQNILSDFENNWHNSLKHHDPKAIFPLPPQLQYLHPGIERLATAQFPVQQQLPQLPQLRLGGGPQTLPDKTESSATPSQMAQQMDLTFTHFLGQQQYPISRSISSPSQLGAPSSRATELFWIPTALFPSPAAPHPFKETLLPAHVDLLHAPKLATVGPKVTPSKPKPRTKAEALETQRGTTKQPFTEAWGTNNGSTYRSRSKRGRESDVTGLDGSAGPSTSPKRARTEYQDGVDDKRNADIIAAKRLPIEGSLDFLEKEEKEYERISTMNEKAAAKPAAVPPTCSSVGEADAYTNSITPLADPPTLVPPPVEATEMDGLDFWASTGVPEGRYYSDDFDWKWEGKMETNGEWPIIYPNA
ncbi:hypothetical protein FRB90_011409 [Tulasnella sp. 427]|nr:hypothetical protein FRB90_011409 [Tulasnella sp. 427]